MPLAEELAALFERDLTRCLQQLSDWGDSESIWQTPPGVANSAGNLVLHLEGNLREFVGRILGGLDYERKRDLEFSSRGLPALELIRRIEEARSIVPAVVAGLSGDVLDSVYPGNPLGTPLSTRQFLVHLLGHLNYHLGQIDYLRRVSTGRGAVEYARLP